jgi:hypothetical protein
MTSATPLLLNRQYVVPACLCLLLLSVCFVNSRPGPSPIANAWVSIYDGRLAMVPAEISKADETILKQQALVQADNQMHGGVSEFEILDQAQGAFTKKGAAQKLFLYRYVQNGHYACTNGLVVIESGKVVWHWAYAGECDSGIKCLPDINLDGLNEVAIENVHEFQGYMTRKISIVELTPEDVISIGSIKVGDDDSNAEDNAAVDDAQKTTLAYQVFAKPGNEPLFRVTKYKRADGMWPVVATTTLIRPADVSVDFFEI